LKGAAVLCQCGSETSPHEPGQNFDQPFFIAAFLSRQAMQIAAGPGMQRGAESRIRKITSLERASLSAFLTALAAVAPGLREILARSAGQCAIKRYRSGRD
jgi:hypothetical protein